jgi:hypothetical protein
LWSPKKRVYVEASSHLDCQKSVEVRMAEGFSLGERSLQDRRAWRLLLARLHPDAGGDHELFLFACALMESVCGKRRAGPGPGHAFSHWRGGMDSWASRNREGLRRPHRGP